MAQKGRNLIALDQDDVVHVTELPCPPLSGMKCEVLLHHAEASLQQSNGFLHFLKGFAVFVTADCCFCGRDSHNRWPSKSQNMVAILLQWLNFEIPFSKKRSGC
jgi:hypothetical protein